ncbi:MAG: hypothetical protein HKL80_01400 [Acidimicrobiales bacterium]|nr:hypothetical protein [Acidimicrobiales bacterium]
MTSESDVDNKMQEIFRHFGDSLLAGDLDPADAPIELRNMAELIQVAKKVPLTSGLNQEQTIISHFRAAFSPQVVELEPKRRSKMISKILTAKAAAAAVAVLFGGTAAAAATGSLPAPAQTKVASVLSDVGVSVPNPSSNAAKGANHVTGPVITSANAFGLCTAYTAQVNGGSTSTSSGATVTSSPALTHSRAFINLEAAAKAANESVAQYCASVKAPSSDKGSSNAASHSKGRSESRGKGNEPNNASNDNPSSSVVPSSVAPTNPTSTMPVPSSSVPATTEAPATTVPVTTVPQSS